MNLNDVKELAISSGDIGIAEKFIEEALLIRLVEQKFLELFSKGKMNGTVHTCVGQEFSAVAVAGQLNAADWVTSNHRCHGHFIARTKNWQGLIDELMGRKSGVCKGIGSSQHLFAEGFLSNGIQGGLLPVGTGIALHKKNNNQNGIVVSFVGEGTLGEGVIYEAMNLSSLYRVPQLFVCENNFYSQSTPQELAVAGTVSDRPKAFGLKTFEADTWNLPRLFQVCAEAIDYVRSGEPAFLTISTYRLNAHSKGDDDRAADEISFFRDCDPLGKILRSPHWVERMLSLQEQIDQHVANGDNSVLTWEEYCKDQLPRFPLANLEPISNRNIRMVQALNDAYLTRIENGACFIGEDIVDPYGGAFKVTRGFSTKYPDRVFGTPISEGGLVGVAIGMALMGSESFAEIMFGDFVTLAFDQIVNNASKMHHMYAFQASVPVRIRTPMGGKRGYGPTHSQSLEKFLVGIDNTLVVALSSLVDPSVPINELSVQSCPVIILENKVDYSRLLWQGTPFYSIKRESKLLGACLIAPLSGNPAITIVSYGETARHLADNLDRFFEQTDILPELVAITLLHPMDTALLDQSVSKTGAVIVVEDGSIHFGIGAEIIAGLAERKIRFGYALRVGAEPYPIPSISSLEMQVLPVIDVVIRKFNESMSGKTYG